MRINQYLARSSNLSRRGADKAIEAGRVTVNGKSAKLSYQVEAGDKIELDGSLIAPLATKKLILNKPVGYVCSRDGQGAKTIYDLLPSQYQNLNPVGRLDKDSSGLLVMTNDGALHHKLAHPSAEKEKVYEITLNQPLSDTHKQQIEKGVDLEDGPSKLDLSGSGKQWQVKMREGRNRQIRRTFETLGYRIKTLHRTSMGEYKLSALNPGDYLVV